MDPVFACDMTAMTAAERARHGVLASKLRPAIAGTEELEDGYVARFAMENELLLALAEFVTLERLCCPWLTLAIEAERGGGPLKLRVTSVPAAKSAIRAEFGFP
jgi:hypothetical protein